MKETFFIVVDSLVPNKAFYMSCTGNMMFDETKQYIPLLKKIYKKSLSEKSELTICTLINQSSKQEIEVTHITINLN